MYSQNFLGANKQQALSSLGEMFSVGEQVAHQDDGVGYATIQSFEFDEKTMEVRANTDKGYAHIDFLVSLKDKSCGN